MKIRKLSEFTLQDYKLVSVILGLCVIFSILGLVIIGYTWQPKSYYDQLKTQYDKLAQISLEQAISNNLSVVEVKITSIEISPIYDAGYELYPIKRFMIKGTATDLSLYDWFYNFGGGLR